MIIKIISTYLLILTSSFANAFCGFYVAKADTTIFNKASKVVLVRDGDKTVLTMANDFQGDVKEFAVVIPVPTAIEKGQVHVGDKTVVDHLDAFTSPRLVEYFDSDPCQATMSDGMAESMGVNAVLSPSSAKSAMRAQKLGVTIEAAYTVGEYDIMILSAKESDGLAQWLNETGYKMPKGTEPILKSYINQKMKFFIAKVNLEEQSKTGFTYLRPLQVAYESPKFMLPIRLGTVNSNGPQELFIFALTKNGRIESTNYRTVKLPSEVELPPYIKTDFADFYKSMFSEQVRKENMRTIFLEYAWDMGWCDPCASDPLTSEELRKLGVFWINKPNLAPPMPGGFNRRMMPQQVNSAYVTRLHVRYDAKSFPEDLVFQETQNKENFQGRYILRHPFTGAMSCKNGEQYKKDLPVRLNTEAKNLASLTGWDINEIRKKVKIPDTKEKEKKWFEDIWE